MSKTKFVRTNNRGEGVMVWNVLIALGIGALLGVLVAVPYDRVIGLSEPTCTILRSVVSVAVLGGLNIYRANETPERTPGSFFVQGTLEQKSPFARLLIG
jgi:hypothetical protein